MKLFKQLSVISLSTSISLFLLPLNGIDAPRLGPQEAPEDVFIPPLRLIRLPLLHEAELRRIEEIVDAMTDNDITQVNRAFLEQQVAEFPARVLEGLILLTRDAGIAILDE